MKKGNTALPFPSIPKCQQDLILHYLVLQKLEREKLAAGKTYYRNPNPYTIIHYYKSFRAVSRIKGEALALEKRKFIKKPKNPI